jgi:rubrerythrin
LKETLKDLCSGSNRATVRRIEDCLLHDIFPRIIDDEPTVEAQPVKHGYWIGWNCSVCGKSTTHVGAKWCPVCGAKMGFKEI